MTGEAQIIWSMLFGAFGFGYIMYGRRQQHVVALLAGVGLLVAPYLLAGSGLMIAGVGMLLAPFFLRI